MDSRRYKFIENKKQNWVVIHSSKRAEKDLRDRTRLIVKAEESFRTLKSFFEVRPMFHWTKKRIEGHIMLNFLLLVMEQFLLSHIKASDIQENEVVSHKCLRSAIDDLDFSILQINESRFASYSKLSDYQLMILRELNIPIPKNHTF